MTDDEILALTPPLPDDFNDILRDIFDWKDYFFTYRDELNLRVGYCTHCRSTINLELNRTITLSYLEAYQKNHNDFGRCPNCGCWVQWKDRNRGRKKLCEENYIYYFQPLDNGGVVLRTIFCRRDFSKSIKNDFEYDEQHRVFFFDGCTHKFRRRPIYDYRYYYKDDWYIKDSKDFYFERIMKKSTPTPFQSRMYGSYYGGIGYSIEDSILKQGNYKYSCLREFLFESNDNRKRIFQCVEYLDLFSKNPSLVEKMMKQGFKELISLKFECDTRSVINWKKTTVPEALKLTKGEIRTIKNKNYTTIFSIQAKCKFGLTKSNCEKLSKMIRFSDITYFVQLFNNPDFDNNELVKYFYKNKVEVYDYIDYLKQLSELKIEKTHQALFPSDLLKAHNNLSDEILKLRKEKELKELEKKEKKLKEKLKSLRKKLFFENDEYFIRPAEGSRELLIESNTLGHCVYQCYKDKYIKGETIICFIRKKSAPNTPYYTLELSPDYNFIRQCRGKGNCGMTPDIKAFKNEWFEWLHSDERKKENTIKCKKITVA